MKKENVVPFDAVAQQYDQTFTDTVTGRCQREKVYDCTLRQNLIPGNLLELNCGTGEDAVWWAQQDWHVVATDISREMTTAAQIKIQKNSLENKVKVIQSDALLISQNLAKNGLDDQKFHLIFSNFGGINCIPPESLASLSNQLSQKLMPDGKIILVVMGRFCWWETVYFLLKGKLGTAFRRFSSKPVDARLDHETTVKTWYYSPRQIAGAFSAFNIEKIEPVGFWVPPSYLDPLMKRFPSLFNVLQRWEKNTHGRFWAYGADHYYIQLK